MSSSASATTASLLAAPPRGVSPLAGPSGNAVSYAEIERGMARGRELRAAALRGGLRRVFSLLVGGCSLRVLRLSGDMPGQRHSCC